MAAELDRTLAALADPTRRAIVERLRNRPQRPSEVAEALSMSRPAMSRHLRVLRRAGLIAQEALEEDARARVIQLRTEPLSRAARVGGGRRGDVGRPAPVLQGARRAGAPEAVVDDRRRVPETRHARPCWSPSLRTSPSACSPRRSTSGGGGDSSTGSRAGTAGSFTSSRGSVAGCSSPSRQRGRPGSSRPGR